MHKKTKFLTLIALFIFSAMQSKNECFCNNRIDGFSLSRLQLDFLDYKNKHAFETVLDNLKARYNSVAKMSRNRKHKLPRLDFVGQGTSPRFVFNSHVVNVVKQNNHKQVRDPATMNMLMFQNVREAKRVYSLGDVKFFLYYHPNQVHNRLNWHTTWSTEERFFENKFGKKEKALKSKKEKIIFKKKTGFQNKQSTKISLPLSHSYTFSHYMANQFEFDVCINFAIFINKMLRRHFNKLNVLDGRTGTPIDSINYFLTNKKGDCENGTKNYNIWVSQKISVIGKKNLKKILLKKSKYLTSKNPIVLTDAFQFYKRWLLTAKAVQTDNNQVNLIDFQGQKIVVQKKIENPILKRKSDIPDILNFVPSELIDPNIIGTRNDELNHTQKMNNYVQSSILHQKILKNPNFLNNEHVPILQKGKNEGNEMEHIILKGELLKEKEEQEKRQKIIKYEVEMSPYINLPLKMKSVESTPTFQKDLDEETDAPVQIKKSLTEKKQEIIKSKKVLFDDPDLDMDLTNLDSVSRKKLQSLIKDQTNPTVKIQESAIIIEQGKSSGKLIPKLIKNGSFNSLKIPLKQEFLKATKESAKSDAEQVKKETELNLIKKIDLKIRPFKNVSPGIPFTLGLIPNETRNKKSLLFFDEKAGKTELKKPIENPNKTGAVENPLKLINDRNPVSIFKHNSIVPLTYKDMKKVPLKPFRVEDFDTSSIQTKLLYKKPGQNFQDVRKVNIKDTGQSDPELKDSLLILKEFVSEFPVSLEHPEFEGTKNTNLSLYNLNKRPDISPEIKETLKNTAGQNQIGLDKVDPNAVSILKQKNIREAGSRINNSDLDLLEGLKNPLNKYYLPQNKKVQKGRNDETDQDVSITYPGTEIEKDDNHSNIPHAKHYKTNKPVFERIKTVIPLKEIALDASKLNRFLEDLAKNCILQPKITPFLFPNELDETLIQRYSQDDSVVNKLNQSIYVPDVEFLEEDREGVHTNKNGPIKISETYFEKLDSQRESGYNQKNTKTLIKKEDTINPNDLNVPVTNDDRDNFYMKNIKIPKLSLEKINQNTSIQPIKEPGFVYDKNENIDFKSNQERESLLGKSSQFQKSISPKEGNSLKDSRLESEHGLEINLNSKRNGETSGFGTFRESQEPSVFDDLLVSRIQNEGLTSRMYPFVDDEDNNLFGSQKMNNKRLFETNSLLGDAQNLEKSRETLDNESSDHKDVSFNIDSKLELNKLKINPIDVFEDQLDQPTQNMVSYYTKIEPKQKLIPDISLNKLSEDVLRNGNLISKNPNNNSRKPSDLNAYINDKFPSKETKLIEPNVDYLQENIDKQRQIKNIPKINEKNEKKHYYKKLLNGQLKDSKIGKYAPTNINKLNEKYLRQKIWTPNQFRTFKQRIHSEKKDLEEKMESVENLVLPEKIDLNIGPTQKHLNYMNYFYSNSKNEHEAYSWFKSFDDNNLQWNEDEKMNIEQEFDQSFIFSESDILKTSDRNHPVINNLGDTLQGLFDDTSSPIKERDLRHENDDLSNQKSDRRKIINPFENHLNGKDSQEIQFGSQKSEIMNSKSSKSNSKNEASYQIDNSDFMKLTPKDTHNYFNKNTKDDKLMLRIEDWSQDEVEEDFTGLLKKQSLKDSGHLKVIQQKPRINRVIIEKINKLTGFPDDSLDSSKNSHMNSDLVDKSSIDGTPIKHPLNQIPKKNHPTNSIPINLDKLIENEESLQIDKSKNGLKVQKKAKLEIEGLKKAETMQTKSDFDEDYSFRLPVKMECQVNEMMRNPSESLDQTDLIDMDSFSFDKSMALFKSNSQMMKSFRIEVNLRSNQYVNILKRSESMILEENRMLEEQQSISINDFSFRSMSIFQPEQDEVNLLQKMENTLNEIKDKQMSSHKNIELKNSVKLEMTDSSKNVMAKIIEQEMNDEEMANDLLNETIILDDLFGKEKLEESMEKSQLLEKTSTFKKSDNKIKVSLISDRKEQDTDRVENNVGRVRLDSVDEEKQLEHDELRLNKDIIGSDMQSHQEILADLNMIETDNLIVRRVAEGELIYDTTSDDMLDFNRIDHKGNELLRHTKYSLAEYKANRDEFNRKKRFVLKLLNTFNELYEEELIKQKTMSIRVYSNLSVEFSSVELSHEVVLTTLLMHPYRLIKSRINEIAQKYFVHVKALLEYTEDDKTLKIEIVNTDEMTGMSEDLLREVLKLHGEKFKKDNPQISIEQIEEVKN